MTSNADIVRDKVFYVRQDLKQLFPGIPFKIRVIVDRGHIRVNISCLMQFDQKRMTGEMQTKIREISLRYSNDIPHCPWDEMQLQKAGSE